MHFGHCSFAGARQRTQGIEAMEALSSLELISYCGDCVSSSLMAAAAVSRSGRGCPQA